MNELKVISINGQLVTGSREVASKIDRPHSDLLKSIRGYLQHLTKGNFPLSDFFIESNYEDSTGRKLPSYYLTRKGCDMVANKMTGEKGVLFTAAYVTRFEEMEHQMKQPSNRKLLLETALEHEKKIEAIETDVSYLKDSMRIDGGQEHHLQRIGKKVVMKSLGGYNSPAYKELSRKVFRRFWRDFNNHFMIPRYGELPKVKFDEAIEFIKVWLPDTSMRMEIQVINRQQVMKDVI